MVEDGPVANSLAPSPTEAVPGDSLIEQFYSFPNSSQPLPAYESVSVEFYVRPEANSLDLNTRVKP